MTRLGHIFAVLVFAFALLAGAAGGAMAHVGPMDHHHSHHAPADKAPAQDGSRHDHSHKAALTVSAPCCPAVEAPAKHGIAFTVTTVRIAWSAHPAYIPDARAIAPEPHPPKTSL